MLARVNRVTRPADFRAAVRSGRRAGSATTVVHLRERGETGPVRFGFIVSKAVGGAVARNTVRRRLRAVCFQLVETAPAGTDVVIRALPGSDRAEWATLHKDVTECISRAVIRA